MTNTNRGTPELRLDDEQAVHQLLSEAGFPEDAGLRQVLLQLRALRTADVPAPSAELRALMGAPETADIIPFEHRKKPRMVLTTLAVAASLGVAGGAAAGNETVRRGAEATISTIVRSFTPEAPAGPATPAPASTAPVPPAPTPGAEAPNPGAAVGPVPAGHSPTVAPPAAPSEGAEEVSGSGEKPADGRREADQNPQAPADVTNPGPGASSVAPGNFEHAGKAPAPHPTPAPANGGQPATAGQEEPDPGRPSSKGRPDTGAPEGVRPMKIKPDPGR